jgi:hypothetical protein
MSKLKIRHVTINVHVAYADESGKDPANYAANDSVSLNFADENELNRALAEKPHFAEAAPALIKKILESHDQENKNAKKLLSAIG